MPSHRFVLLLFAGSLTVFAQDDSPGVPISDAEPATQAAPAPLSPAPGYAPISLGENFHYSFNRVFSPGKLALFSLKAAMDQERRVPDKWWLGADGFGERWADHFGRALVRENTAFAMRALDGEDPRYEPSLDTGVWKRSKHAVARTFLVRGHNGRLMPAYSRFIAEYGTPLIASQWEPNRFSAAHALGVGTGGIGLAVASNLGTEFWPDIRHRFFHRQ